MLVTALSAILLKRFSDFRDASKMRHEVKTRNKLIFQEEVSHLRTEELQRPEASELSMRSLRDCSNSSRNYD